MATRISTEKGKYVWCTEEPIDVLHALHKTHSIEGYQDIRIQKQQGLTIQTSTETFPGWELTASYQDHDLSRYKIDGTFTDVRRDSILQRMIRDNLTVKQGDLEGLYIDMRNIVPAGNTVFGNRRGSYKAKIPTILEIIGVYLQISNPTEETIRDLMREYLLERRVEQ